jgi:hypothetical protein
MKAAHWVWVAVSALVIGAIGVAIYFLKKAYDDSAASTLVEAVDEADEQLDSVKDVFKAAADRVQSGEGLFPSDGLFGTGLFPGLF